MSKEHILQSDDDIPGSPFQEASLRHLEQCVKSEIVTAQIVGIKDGFRTMHVWNVLTDEGFEHTDHLGHVLLEQNAREFIAKAGTHIPLRIANVRLSHAESLSNKYLAAGVELYPMSLDESKAYEELLPHSTQSGEPVDILIGGLRPFEEQMKGVIEKAATFRSQLPERDTTPHLSIFDETNELTAQLLKSITLARLARRDHGIFTPFAVMEEPYKVLKEIGEERYLAAHVNVISELDVRGAIESGALRVK